MPIKAVLFDFDGTLVDTMPIHYEAYRRVFADVGVVLSQDDFYGNIGGKATEAIPKFLGGRPCSLSVEEIHQAKKRLVATLFESEPIPVLDTAYLLELLLGRVPMALASSGSRPGIEGVLRRLGWKHYFQVVVTGEEVQHGKPASDLFLLAAERLSVEPAACLVFEDTDAGVAAAKAANMVVADVRKMAGPTSLRASLWSK